MDLHYYESTHTVSHLLIIRLNSLIIRKVCDSWLALSVISVNTFPLGNYEHISTM